MKMKFCNGPLDGVFADWHGPLPDKVAFEFLGPALGNRAELTDQEKLHFDLRQRKIEYVLTNPDSEEAVYEESPPAQGWWVC